MSSIRQRIEALYAKLPKEIVLTLDDGTTFHHRGPLLKFAAEAMTQAESGGGPIVTACCRAAKATGCGLVFDLIAAIAEPEEKKGRHAHRRRSRATSRRCKTNGAGTRTNGQKR
jgi:hypothetical protein